MSDYLTTSELAELLRIKERKVYDLAASGTVPCTRATGKLLFPREAISAWLAEHHSGPETAGALPTVMLGSHDPLLDWAIRESRCGLAALFDSSTDGLTRFADRQGVATGLHLLDAESDSWNRVAAGAYCAGMQAVLIGWASRQRGLILSESAVARVTDIRSLAGRKIAARQPEAGAQGLLLHLLKQAGLSASDVEMSRPVRSEQDAVLMVRDGKADAALGLASLARQHRLTFIPLVEERFDLLVDRRAWFDPPMQSLLAFCRQPDFAAQARDLGGYDLAELGVVRLNGL